MKTSTPAPELGLVEWFRPGEHDRVEHVLQRMQSLKIKFLRTAVSWADWHTPHGESWYRWLLPRLTRDVSLLPCFLYTPPSLGVSAKAAAPPRDPKAYADFLDQIITELGGCFQTVELWNEPNNLSEYDWTLDPGWNTFCEMIGGAAYWARQRGKKTVLGGMAPADPNWLSTIGCNGVLEHIDVVGIHGFPGVWEFAWEGWEYYLDETRAVLESYNSDARIWITETGYSTWRHDLRGQLHAFVEAMDAPVERVYWYAVQDLNPMLATVDGFHSDERDYHFGLTQADGEEKLLCRVLRQEGSAGARSLERVSRPSRPAASDTSTVLITGGAGFVGTNLADRLLTEGRSVAIYDNLSRPGAERNLEWLLEQHGTDLRLHLADVRDEIALRNALPGVAAIFHLAGQVAVTTSLISPVHDFDVNGRGTINLLEAIRRQDTPPLLIFTSTNKVYGGLDDLQLQVNGDRYEPADPDLARLGISEHRELDFHSPYGCSKGTADQYVLDYARTYDLPATVFRMSCIYGPHQMGNEDQGWVAHFLLRVLQGQPITIFGDGRQVRDVLFVDDLVDAFLLAEQNIDTISGQAFNIGGGPRNVLSLLDLVDQIERLHGYRPLLHHGDWRTGDQRYYVSDTRKFREAVGWHPTVKIEEGLVRLYDWLIEAHGLGETQARHTVGAP